MKINKNLIIAAGAAIILWMIYSPKKAIPMDAPFWRENQ